MHCIMNWSKRHFVIKTISRSRTNSVKSLLAIYNAKLTCSSYNSNNVPSLCNFCIALFQTFFSSFDKSDWTSGHDLVLLPFCRPPWNSSDDPSGCWIKTIVKALSLRMCIVATRIVPVSCAAEGLGKQCQPCWRCTPFISHGTSPTIVSVKREVIPSIL